MHRNQTRPGAFRLLPLLLAGLLAACAPTLPENTPVTEARWLDQNWDAEERFWFHHASQGTATLPVPYAWFLALERPELSLGAEPGLISDEDYLRRLGFIPSPRSLEAEGAAYGYRADAAGRQWGGPATYDRYGYEGNPDGLPVGFVRTRVKSDPLTGGALEDQIGFTCAACHTGHLEYEGVSLRIDGAPAMTDLGKLREIIGLSLVYTRYVPGRFDRFAGRVLGPDHTEEESDALFERLDALLEKGKALQAVTGPVAEADVEEGFARLDALNRIGNRVFFVDLLGGREEGFDPAVNYAPVDAPVNYPHIWGSSWFDWVQYDGSIAQPMVRNAGEALGVSALLNLAGPGEGLYASTIEVRDIFHMEELLAGEDPHAGVTGFKGLRPPAWPAELFGPIDPGQRARGAVLYKELCQGCHLPAPGDAAFWAGEHWSAPDKFGRRYLDVHLISLDKVGTDPAQAEVMIERRVKLPAYLEIDPGALCGGEGTGVVTETSFAEALAAVVEKAADHWYAAEGIGQEERERMNGYRPNCVQAKRAYKARPLDGIWATAPFLHNGSVPNLYALLSPVEERPDRFCLGSRLYDPVKVGYSTDCVPGAFELDTSIPGNRNKGHEFRDGPHGKGTIGRALSPTERMDLIAFLKGL